MLIQLVVLRTFLRNLYVIVPFKKSFYVLAVILIVISMIITNGLILPENATNEKTMWMMCIVFSGMSCLVLVAMHIAIGLIRKRK